MAECGSNVNVQVAVRCRPLNIREKTAGNLHVVTTEPNHNRIRVAHKKLDRTYQYDHVFGPFASQEEVFTATVEPIVREMLQGFSTTVFAYGQTGTGKTHTMEGDIASPENMGVIPRSVHAIFDYLEGISADYTVRTSFLELYNEELQDLLANTSIQKSKVVLREDTKRGVVCCGLEEVQVLSAKDIFSILERGIQQRKTAETLMNKNSSRSHSIFTLKIMIKECMPDGQEVMRNGQLNLVDLAGSECVGRSGATNVRAREAGNINQSLLTLGRVITALVEHHPHVPYRDSKLTRLLQESLGGRAKTCIITTVTSSSDALEETLSSLDYAMKAKNIENKPVANQKLSKTHLLKEYAGEVETLRSMLQASREKNGIYVEPWRFEQMENTIISQNNQITEVELILASKSAEVKDLKTDRDSYRLKGEELEEALEASKAREEAASARLAETLGELERTRDDLSKSRAQVVDLQKHLAATERVLKVTEEELGATRAVVAEQEATERVLLSEAEQTKRSLALAEEDVEGLRAKVARQEDGAAAKRENASAFRENASSATTEVSRTVARFAGKHSEGCQGLRESLIGAEMVAKAATMELAEAAAFALGEVDRGCKELLQGVVDGAKSADSLVGLTASTLEAALQEQKGAISAWHHEVEAALVALRQGLETHDQDLTELSEEVSNRVQEVEREMVDFRDACATELAEVRCWADARIATQTEQMERQSEKAKAVAAISKEETKEEIARLMQSLSALMSGLQANASERADRQASAAKEAWSRSIAAARSLGPEVSQKMGGISESFASGSKTVVEKLVSSSTATQTTIKSHREAAKMLASSATEASTRTSEGAARTSSAVDTAGTSLKGNLPAVSASVSGSADECFRDAQAICEGAGAAAERLSALASSSVDMSAERARETDKKVERLASAVGDLESTHASSLGRYISHVEDHVEEACRVPGTSGGTPERKRYPRPDKFSATRPVGEIMSDFRLKGKSPLHSPRKCLAAVPGDQGEALSSAAPTELLGDSSDEAGGGVEQDASCVSTTSALEGPLVGGEVVEESAVVAEPKSDSSRSTGFNENACSGNRNPKAGNEAAAKTYVRREIPKPSVGSVTERGGGQARTGTPSPPLNEATNTSSSSNANARGANTKTKIPMVRRTSRRTRAR